MTTQNTKNTTWPFNLDHVVSWAYWDDAFSEEECQKIIDYGANKILLKGETRSDGQNYIRESKICWLYPSEGNEWIFRKMTDIVMSLNERFFKFNLFGALEGFQFTKYDAPSGRYGKHIDSAHNHLIRKLSFTLQLSSPDDYDGGDLALHFSDKPDMMPRKKGSVIVFPSYVLHEVTPVTKGTRFSLVSWITGESFK